MSRHREIARFDQILDTTPIARYIADEKSPVTGSPATGFSCEGACLFVGDLITGYIVLRYSG
jgi:hypothetical protein